MNNTLDRLAPSKTQWVLVEQTESPPWATSKSNTSTQRPSRPRTVSLIDPGTGYRLATDDGSRPFADALRRIQQHSGLDWGQIANTLGVSRRTVHNWLGGAKVRGVNVRRVSALYSALMDELAKGKPDDPRSFLLAPSPDGESPLARITRHLRAQYATPRPVLAPTELLASPESGDSAPITGSPKRDVQVHFIGRHSTKK